MVGVQYNEHIVINRIVNYLVNSCHPCGVNLVVLVHVSAPAYGQSQNIEARLAYKVYHFFGGSRVAPGDLGINCAVAACSVKGVSEVPAYSHLSNEVPCGLIAHFLLCVVLAHVKLLRVGFAAVTVVACACISLRSCLALSL